MSINITNPREQAYIAIEGSAKKANINYIENGKRINSFLKDMRSHRLFSHPVFEALRSGKFDKKSLQELHLDYRMIVKQFTDLILITQFKTRELSQLSDELFMQTRFLITLNIFDELGFWPGEKEYLGNPYLSHFLLFDEVINDLGIEENEKVKFKNSIEAKHLYEYLENSMDNLHALLVYLIITEEGAMYYSPAMRESAKQYGVDVSKGYYNVHGDTEDAMTEGEDDLHQDDIVRIMQLILTEENYLNFLSLSKNICDLWADFWDAQYNRIS
ncbi:hypothetical protein [Sulfurimonas sp.]